MAIISYKDQESGAEETGNVSLNKTQITPRHPIFMYSDASAKWILYLWLPLSVTCSLGKLHVIKSRCLHKWAAIIYSVRHVPKLDPLRRLSGMLGNVFTAYTQIILWGSKRVSQILRKYLYLPRHNDNLMKTWKRWQLGVIYAWPHAGSFQAQCSLCRLLKP